MSHPFSNLEKEICNEEELFELADFFKVFGDSTRLKIINALLSEELCVGDIAELLNMSSSAVSHQLRFLKNLRVIRSRRSGKMVYYTLDDEHVEEIFRIGHTHLCHKKRQGAK